MSDQICPGCGRSRLVNNHCDRCGYTVQPRGGTAPTATPELERYLERVRKALEHRQDEFEHGRLAGV